MSKFSKMKKSELEAIAINAFTSLENLQSKLDGFTERVSEIDAIHAKLSQYQYLTGELENISEQFDSATYQQKLNGIDSIYAEAQILEQSLLKPKTGLQARLNQTEENIKNVLNDATNSLKKMIDKDG